MLSELQKTNKISVIINIIPQLLHAPFTLYLNDVVGVGSIDRTFIENWKITKQFEKNSC